MKIKRIFAILCATIMISSVPVFASCQSTQPQYVSQDVEIRNGTITFITRCERHKVDYRCYPELDISIKENRAGLLRDGDILYFETSRDDDKYVTNYNNEIKASGLTAEEVKMPDKQNHFAIRIERGNKNELAQIDIHLGAEFVGVSYKDESFPTFALYLDADKTKEHNLFAGEQNILLNEKFLVLVDSVAEKERLDNEIQKSFKEKLPVMMFLTDCATMTWNEQQIPLKYPIYINKAGSAMLSLEDFEYIINHVGGTITHIGNDINSNIDMHCVKAGKYTFNIVPDKNAVGTQVFTYQKETMYDVLEEKDSVNYISLRAVAMILDMEDYITWNNDTKTITISNE